MAGIESVNPQRGGGGALHLWVCARHAPSTIPYLTASSAFWYPILASHFSRWPALVLEDDVTFAPLLELPGGRRAVSATLVDAEAGGARWGVLQLG